MKVSAELKAVRAAPAPPRFPSDCPSRKVLDHVTSKWGVLVLLSLADGTLRWGQLRRTVDGVSEKMLAQTLQILERDGLVHREAMPVIPPHVEYSLTGLGAGLVEHLLPLMGWLLENSPGIVERYASPQSSEQRLDRTDRHAVTEDRPVPEPVQER